MVVGGLFGEAAGGALVASMDKLKDTIRESIDFADRAQKASLALGSTFEETNSSLGGTMEGLRGDINQKFAAGIAGMEAGLQGNTAGVARLVNQQMLTGTAYKKTAQAFAGLEATLGLSREETNNLAASLVQTGAEYQISTDELVKAVDSLKATFPAQALAGMGNKVMTATAQLQSELGPQMAGPLNSVMKMVMDTSMQGYEKLTMLGIGGVRERLSAAKDSAEAQKILKDAFVTASDRFKDVAGDASEGFFKLGVASDLFGQQSINFTTISDNFGKRVKKEIEEVDKFANTLKVLTSEILVPLKMLFATSIFPALIKFVPVLKLVAATFLDGIRLILNSLSGWFDKTKEFISNLFTQFKTDADFAAKALHWGIVVPLQAVKLAFGAFEAGLGVIILAIVKLAEVIARAISKISFGLLEVQEDKVDMLTDFATSMIESGVNAQNEAWDRITRDPVESGNALKEAMNKSRNDPNLLGNKMLANVIDLMRAGNQTSQSTADNTKNIDAKTPEIATTPEFLDQTANMLGRSIEGILGVGRDTTAEEMLEELREANLQRAKAATEAPTGEGHTATNSQNT
tara:strand:+ start:642 stop:2369 length:1728 start_codon:yes stop_codon:yes gene_type:complete